MENIFIYIAAGISAIFSSLVGSFSGGGSSLVLLPILLLFAPGNYLTILTTTKISATIMALTSSRVHYKKSVKHLKLLAVIVFGAFIGTGIGTYIVQFHPNESFFKKLMAGILVLAIFYLIKDRNRGVEEKKDIIIDGKILLMVGTFSLFINILNGIIGGTGIFITILLVSLGFAFIDAVAYTMATYALINLLHVAYLLTISFVDYWMILAVILGSVVGAFMGTHLQYLKGNKIIKKASILMMVLIALKMFEG